MPGSHCREVGLNLLGDGLVARAISLSLNHKKLIEGFSYWGASKGCRFGESSRYVWRDAHSQPPAVMVPRTRLAPPCLSRLALFGGSQPPGSCRKQILGR